MPDQQVKLFGPASQAAEENTDANDVGGFDTDPFWDFAAADELQPNWNALFPYQLLVLKRINGAYTSTSIVDKYTLPIPPTQMTIDTPFAIETSVTMGGIIEEHNAAPLRMISMAGTTGILPLRSTVAQPSSFDQGGAIFAGVASGINQVSSALKTGANLLGIATNPINVHGADEFTGGLGKSTGYYQFHLLKRFLENYATQKKTDAGKELRLALAIWKDQEIYIVSPVSFSVRRDASSPLEYQYSLQLKAWRRVLLSENAVQPYKNQVGIRDINKLAKVINTLQTGQRVVEGLRATLTGFRADIQNILYTPLRQASLFVKDIIGLTLTAVDLPSDIISDFKEPILEASSLANSFSALRRIDNRFTNSIKTSTKQVQDAFNALSISSGKADTQGGRVATKQQSLNPTNASPATKIANDPIHNFDYFSTVNISDLNLRPNTVKKIQAERQKVRLLKREDFERMRDDALRLLADYSDFCGAGDPTYTAIFGLPIRITTRIPNDIDWQVIQTLSQIAQSYDSLCASATVNRDIIDTMDYVAGLASRSGIAFTIPQSKFAVPFPYGSTLEQLSALYLGTPDRWHEIATLNGLLAPYVDELGFFKTLLVNGNGNQIVVADIDNLNINQKIWISSNTVRRESRHIQKIVQIDTTHYALTLDGNTDLNRFTTAAVAQIQAFLPNTVNSQMQIFIPSNKEPDETNFFLKAIPGVNYFDPLVNAGGIDLLLTTGGDLVITPDGDSKLAVGLVNIIQKVRLALATPKGSLLHHPDYGLGVLAGTATADISAKELLSQTKTLFKDDSGFTGVTNASIRKTGNALFIGLTVGIAGTSQFIPVEIQVKN